MYLYIAAAPSTIVAPGYYAQTVSGPSTVGAPGTYQMTPFIAPGYGYKTGHPQLPMGYQNHGGPPPSYAQPTGAQATPGAPPMEAQPGNQSASNELPPSYATTIGPNSVAPTVIQPGKINTSISFMKNNVQSIFEQYSFFKRLPDDTILSSVDPNDFRRLPMNYYDDVNLHYVTWHIEFLFRIGKTRMSQPINKSQ